MKFYTAKKMSKPQLLYCNILEYLKHDIKPKKPDTKESYCVVSLT